MSTITGYSSSSYNTGPGIWARILRWLGGRAFLIWVLLLVLVNALGNGLLESTSSLQNVFIYPLLMFGATVGWFIAALPFKGGMAIFLGMFIGVEYLVISVGQLGDNIFAIAGAIGTFLRQLLTWYRTDVPPEWDIVPGMLSELFQDIGVLFGRAIRWLLSLNVNTASYDPVGTVLVWGIGIWFCALWAGWFLRKRSNPMLAILPGGIVQAFVLSYTGSNPYSLLPVMGLTLVMSAMLGHFDREKIWNTANVDYSRGLWSDVVTTASLIAVALVIIAAISPSITYERIANWIDDITRRREYSGEVVAESFGLEQKPEPRAPSTVELAESTSLPRRHLIGSGPELSRIVVMTVDTGEFPPTPNEAFITDEVPRYYWRSLTYDRYFGRGWATSYTELNEYQAGELFIDSEVPHTRLMRQSVKLIGDTTGDLVHVTGQLVSVNEDYAVSVRWPSEMFAATTEIREYRADSLIPVFTEEQLRNVSMDYPVWIIERYTQLPENLPERVSVLARDLTATEPTAYDRALAIEAYLREFPYTLDVPTPGVAQDIADYFLFELQEGYCDYYATSMVVLARAAGLPARLVVGYATGNYDPINARYIVTEADAHAWVEIYFPEYGWIEFEPTGGYPMLDRGTEEEPILWPEGYDDRPPLVEPRNPVTQRILLGQWLLGAVGVVLGIGILASLADTAYLVLLPTRRLLQTLRKRMLMPNQALILHLSPSSTPNEVVQAYTTRMDDLAMDMDSMDTWFQRGKAMVQEMNDIYIAVWYANRGDLTRREKLHLAWLWWSLRWRIVYARWTYRRRMERAPMPEQREFVPKSYIHPQRPAT